MVRFVDNWIFKRIFSILQSIFIHATRYKNMLSNEIIVYYSNKASIFINDPEPLFKNVIDLLKEKNSKQSKQFKRCPAFFKHCENTFVIKNEMNYDLIWRDNDFASSKLDQEYFSTWVKSRNVDDGFVGYLHPSYMFAASEPVTLSLLPPYMHNSDIAHKAIMLPGSYDVGSHVRPLEASMYIKNRNDVINFKKGDPLYYIKFNTDKKITFKKFMWSQDLDMLINQVLYIRNNEENLPLEFWYKIFKSSYRRKFLSIIKNNLM